LSIRDLEEAPEAYRPCSSRRRLGQHIRRRKHCLLSVRRNCRWWRGVLCRSRAPLHARQLSGLCRRMDPIRNTLSSYRRRLVRQLRWSSGLFGLASFCLCRLHEERVACQSGSWLKQSRLASDVIYTTNADVSISAGDGNVGACVDTRAIGSVEWKTICGDRTCVRYGYKFGFVSEISPPTTGWLSANKLNCSK